MDTKILWLSDSTMEHLGSTRDDQELIYSRMLAYARGVARPDTEFVLEFIEEHVPTTFAPYYRYERALMAVEMNERLRQAEEDGFDAAFAGMCFGEFFLQDARQVVKMPVVGAAESAMMLAQLLGSRFGVVTVAEGFVHVIEENIRSHRWEGRAVSNQPVRWWKGPWVAWVVEAMNGKPERLVEEFDRQAQELVRAGADVVICGCNPYGAALAQCGYNEVSGTGVPVVTPLAAMIKFAELMVDIRRSEGLTKSEAVVGPYRSTPAGILADLDSRGIRGPRRPATV